MADTPQLFGKPGKRHSFGWRWKSGPWDVYYEPGDGQHYIEIQHVDCLVFDRWYRQRAAALRATERKLASLVGSLIAMGAPHG